jgi:hypothetical protein
LGVGAQRQEATGQPGRGLVQVGVASEEGVVDVPVLDAYTPLTGAEVEERRDRGEEQPFEEVLEHHVVVADDVVDATSALAHLLQLLHTTGTASAARRDMLVWSISNPSPLMQRLAPQSRTWSRNPRMRSRAVEAGLPRCRSEMTKTCSAVASMITGARPGLPPAPIRAARR